MSESDTYQPEDPWYWELAYMVELLIFVIPALIVYALYYIAFWLVERGDSASTGTEQEER